MTQTARIADIGKPRIIIVGGGFAGIELAKSLRQADAQVILIDKQNHHAFQPLLYQVATAGLEADSIVYPFRKIFEDQKNFYFRMAEVESVDTTRQIVHTTIGEITYDYLVIATGATTNYYGNEQIQEHAVPIKTIEDSIALRNKILSNFERALLTDDDEQMNSLIDYVIVGGGPTGVEIAGALAELKLHVFPQDYRELDFLKMDIHLIQSGPRLLNGMSEEASLKALDFLQELGVHVWLNCRVKSYDGYTVEFENGEKLITRTLIWAAGVCGMPIPGLREESVLKGNRLQVDIYNRVLGYKNIFAIGDVAAMITRATPQGHPMMAPPAMQQGKALGKNICCLLEGKPLKAFRYYDKGSMATIGRNKAVVDLNGYKTQGIIAWFVWMFVHLISIVGYRNRLVVLMNWMWSYFSYDKGIRLIIGNKKEKQVAREKEAMPT
ncbi:NAD(P)/FAD-dependent oxidoreductase [Rhodocytophaga aerolata]|uniref:NADH:ubiquinone reductase (non-electrogenic) n=1 Tax=Rhodocytophaga aerolata TaxID=455078 RepID=A0ABT8R7E8_9BACT|nr:NAD(P)/FAD-dependent oxidoreductase [Rhodocytophaga aerolata]MDO1446682.1 NAD(P)/FAD-dependent oxidoreductase [Rhodocytophaga aerolata]